MPKNFRKDYLKEGIPRCTRGINHRPMYFDRPSRVTPIDFHTHRGMNRLCFPTLLYLIVDVNMDDVYISEFNYGTSSESCPSVRLVTQICQLVS